MFINKSQDGSNNLCGRNVAALRKGLKLSQRQLADRLQVCGLDIDKNAIQRIECGKRFVTDIELVQLAKVLRVEISRLAKKPPFGGLCLRRYTAQSSTIILLLPRLSLVMTASLWRIRCMAQFFAFSRNGASSPSSKASLSAA